MLIRSGDPALHNLVNEGTTKDDDYAKVTLNGAVCAAYPRIVNRVDDVVQRSLDLSCPEAARLALLNSNRIEFVSREHSGDSDATEVDISDLRDSPEPCREFRYACRWAITLLQDRSYPAMDGGIDDT